MFIISQKSPTKNTISENISSKIKEKKKLLLCVYYISKAPTRTQSVKKLQRTKIKEFFFTVCLLYNIAVLSQDRAVPQKKYTSVCESMCEGV